MLVVRKLELIQRIFYEMRKKIKMEIWLIFVIDCRGCICCSAAVINE